MPTTLATGCKVLSVVVEGAAGGHPPTGPAWSAGVWAAGVWAAGVWRGM